MNADADRQVVVELIDVRKRFGATTALDAVSIRFAAGQVHAIVGENGAGKSTLGKVVSGAVTPDRGSVRIGGQEVRLRSPRQAIRLGVAAISQELSLLPARSVLDNVMLGSESVRLLQIDRSEQTRRFRRLTQQFQFDLPADVLVERLSIADQQKVELLRALGRDARLLVVDEPTARLTTHEAKSLIDTLRSLAGTGTTIVLISHFLDEVLDIAETVTVMGDGRIVRTAAAADETRSSLLAAMTGRSIDSTFPPKRPPLVDAPVRLRVREVGAAPSIGPVSIDVRQGEIVGLAGLVGAGRSELAHAIVGATRRTTGSVEIDGVALPNGRVGRSIERGVSMIPESRRTQGLVIDRSIRENVALPYLRSMRRRLLSIDAPRERAWVKAICDRVGVNATGTEQSVGSLSGGNQQKVLFARAMLREPAVLIADEPTRGVDVAAKQAIYQLIADLAAAGAGVLVISSEMEEVLGLSHRVLVMRHGQIVAELVGPDIDEANVLAAGFGTDSTIDRAFRGDLT